MGVNHEDNRSRRRIVGCTLFALLGVVTIIAVVKWRLESRFIYSHYFSSRRFGIEFGTESDFYGVEHRVLQTSYYYPPALIVGIKIFRTPDDREPHFHLVSDDINGLHCVYDTLGWGYLAIIDTSDTSCKYFCSGTSDDPLEWRDKYEILLRIDPDIPYAEIFQNVLRQTKEEASQ